MKKALPKRPFLLRAMHQWITECGHTPHVIVDAGRDGAEVPRAYVKDGKIVLNLSYGATQHLDIGADWLEFDARFGGVSRHVRVPLTAVLAVYASENGQGMLFDADEEAVTPAAPAGDPPKPDGPKKPTLKVIK